MKIVCSFNKSERTEWTSYNIIDALRRTGHEIIECDWYPLYARYGRRRGSELLVETVLQEKPDIFFGYLSTEWVNPDSVRRITDAGIITVNYFCDGSHLFDVCIREFGNTFTYQTDTHLDGIYRYKEICGVTPVYLQQATLPSNRGSGIAKDIDVSFVGQLYGVRKVWLDRIRAEGIKVVHKYDVSTDEMFDTYRRSWIGLNISYNATTGDTDIKQRDFEIPGCGALLFTFDQPEIYLYYDVNTEIVVYSSLADLIQKLRFMLERKDLTAQRSEAGYQRVQAMHTWDNRIAFLLDFIQKDRQIQPVIQEGYSKLDQNDPAGAVESFLKARQIFPVSIEAACGLAKSFIQTGRYPEAAQTARELLAVYPHLGDAYDLLAAAYSKAGDYRRAERVLLKAAQDKEADYRFPAMLAEVHKKAGIAQGVRHWYEEALKRVKDEAVKDVLYKEYAKITARPDTQKKKSTKQMVCTLTDAGTSKDMVAFKGLFTTEKPIGKDNMAALIAQKAGEENETFDGVSIQSLAEYMREEDHEDLCAALIPYIKDGGELGFVLPDFDRLFLPDNQDLGFPGSKGEGQSLYPYLCVRGPAYYEALCFRLGLEDIRVQRALADNNELGWRVSALKSRALDSTERKPLRVVIAFGPDKAPDPKAGDNRLFGVYDAAELKAGLEAAGPVTVIMVNNETIQTMEDTTSDVVIMAGHPVLTAVPNTGRKVLYASDVDTLYPPKLRERVDAYITANSEVTAYLHDKGVYRYYDYSTVVDNTKAFVRGLASFMYQIV